MDRKTIVVTRDSVAAGDDADAPHSMVIEIAFNDTIETVLKRISEIRYLPKIDGGKATWSVAFKQPLAVIAQEWDQPKLISSANQLIQHPVDQLHFNYHAQDDPETVFRVLSRFRAVAS